MGRGVGPVGFGGAACSAAFGAARAFPETTVRRREWIPLVGFGSPLGGGVGDFVSSGIATEGTNLRRRGRLRRTLTSNSLQISVNREVSSSAASFSLHCLVTFNQLTNAQCIGLAMSVAGDWGCPSRGIDANLGPDNSGRDLHRRHFPQGDALLAAAEHSGLEPAHMLRRDDDAHGKKQISLGPAAGGEGLTSSCGWIRALTGVR